MQFTRSVRGLNRLRQIAQVLTQHGFGHIVDRMHLGRFVPVWVLRRKRRDIAELGVPSLGRRLAQVCSELGPTFVKLGQMLTTRPDILPPEVIDDLRMLQDDVPAFGTEEAKRIVRGELGKDLCECFQSFDEQPIASGSIAQVHRAMTLRGDRVVVKVRRPGIGEIIKTDMQLLNWFAESLEHFVPELRAYRPVIIAQEFEQTLRREMDFIHEASVTDRLDRTFAGDSNIRIPHIYWDLCSPRILTMGELTGSSIEKLLREPEDTRARYDTKAIARRLTDSFLEQVFEVGVFHADPHPGNILVEPPAIVGLLDFGQIGTISSETMTQLVIMVYGAVNRNLDVVVDAMAELGALGPSTNRRELHRALRIVLDKYHGLPIKRFDIATVLNEFAEVVRTHDVTIPRETVVLIKALGMVTGTATRLDPELDVLELLKPRLKKSLLDRLSPRHLAEAAAVSGWQLMSLLRTAPGNLREVIRRMASGSYEIKVQHENIDRLANELDRSSNRLSIAVIIAAVIVGSSIVISAGSDLTVFGIGIQSFGVFGYLVAGVLGLTLTWAIFRSGRLH